jgi:hypothetical protein
MDSPEPEVTTPRGASKRLSRRAQPPPPPPPPKEPPPDHSDEDEEEDDDIPVSAPTALPCVVSRPSVLESVSFCRRASSSPSLLTVS